MKLYSSINFHFSKVSKSAERLEIQVENNMKEIFSKHLNKFIGTV